MDESTLRVSPDEASSPALVSAFMPCSACFVSRESVSGVEQLRGPPAEREASDEKERGAGVLKTLRDEEQSRDPCCGWPWCVSLEC